MLHVAIERRRRLDVAQLRAAQPDHGESGTNYGSIVSEIKAVESGCQGLLKRLFHNRRTHWGWHSEQNMQTAWI
jgi:hypothetical protein